MKANKKIATAREIQGTIVEVVRPKRSAQHSAPSDRTEVESPAVSNDSNGSVLNDPASSDFSPSTEQAGLHGVSGLATACSQGESELQGALHEVSNALTVVLGWLTEAKARTTSGAALEALEVAHTHARRGHRVARRAIGAQAESANAFRNAYSIAKDSINATELEASRYGVFLELEDTSDDALIGASDDALQILINLILNALAFSPKGATVSIRCSVKNRAVDFRVQDQGPGVADEAKARLFSAGHSMRSGGAGVGLAHSHELAKRHGGRLTLAPSERGACFELRWPLSDAPSQTIQRAPSDGMRGLRLLLLEDDSAVMGMVRFGLEARGATVDAATNADELEQLSNNPTAYDAALVDFSPIEDDAAATLERLRQKKDNLPIILISGSAVAPEEELPLSAWVQKPFELGDLVSAIREAASDKGKCS